MRPPAVGPERKGYILLLPATTREHAALFSDDTGMAHAVGGNPGNLAPLDLFVFPSLKG